MIINLTRTQQATRMRGNAGRPAADTIGPNCANTDATSSLHTMRGTTPLRGYPPRIKTSIMVAAALNRPMSLSKPALLIANP